MRTNYKLTVYGFFFGFCFFFRVCGVFYFFRFSRANFFLLSFLRIESFAFVCGVYNGFPYRNFAVRTDFVITLIMDIVSAFF